MDLTENFSKLEEYRERARALVAQMTLEEKVEQTVHYRYDEPCDPYYTPFHKGPFTIDQEEYGDYPIKWEDVDQDGNQDILICVKTAMKAKCYGCLLYDPETNDYLPCKGFEEILNPNLGCGDLRGTLGGGIEAFYYKYKVTEEFSVELIGYLVKNYLGGQYSEEHYENGMTIYKKENIKKEDVDIDFWNGHIID